ncbi:MAG TPA: GntR family transcriptional regulator [Labilithrix sp.]
MKKSPRTNPGGTLGTDDPADTLAALAPVARSSVVDAVADRLRNEILAGRVAAGSRLPSERELSLALGVNRLTLRAALARLEAMGLVSTRHGSGTEVASWRERAGLEALAMVLSSLQTGEPAWVELLTSLLEVRRILVSEAIALAAVRHTEEDLAQMRAIAKDLATRIHDPLAFAKGDLMFQRAVIRATRNVGLELMLNSFVRFPEELPDLVAQLYDRRDESIALYDAVIELVKAGDGAAARTAALMAFAAIDEDWLKRHGHTLAADKRPKTTARDAKKKAKKGK